MDWDDVRVFLAVARARSVTGAARRLDVQHSTVSRRLRAFEEELGVRLFDRKRSGYVLTPSGEDLKGVAVRMEREALTIDGRMLGRDVNLAGTLRVATADAMAVTFLMPIVTEFADCHPEVDLKLMVSNDYISLSEREADVAIRATNKAPDNLIGHRIATLAFAVYGERRYLASIRKKKRQPAWISAEGGMPHQAWIQRQCQAAPIALTVDEATLTLAALHRGTGVALMPCFMGDPDPRLGRYQDPVEETHLDLWILVHSDLRRTARVRVFRDFATQRLRQQLDLLEGRSCDSG